MHHSPTTSRPIVCRRAVLAAALAAPLAAQAVAFDLPTTRFVLDNGMAVIVAPDPQAALVAVRLFYRVGSGDEAIGATGMAHLFEHMMFNGSAHYRPGELDAVFERSGGYANAVTSQDFTCYMTEVPASSLPAILAVEADRMQALTLDAELLERERAVVLAERRQSIEDRTPQALDVLLQAHLFQSSPYRWPVLGWVADIEEPRSTAAAFYRRHYAPDQAVLVLAGAVEVDAARALVQRAFGALPAGPGFDSQLRAEPDRRCAARLTITRQTPSSVLQIGFLGATAADHDHAATDLLARILGFGATARLVRRLVREERVALSVTVRHDWMRGREPFGIAVTLPSLADAERAERAVFDELRRLCDEGCGDDELARARTGAVADLCRELTTSTGRAFMLGKFEVLVADHRRPFALPAAWAAVDGEALRAAACRLFRADGAVVALLRAEHEVGR